MNRTFKIILWILLTVLAVRSVVVVGQYFYNLHHGPGLAAALVFRNNGEFNFAGNSGAPVSNVKILKQPDGSVAFTFSNGHIPVTQGKCGKGGFFVLDQKSASLWYADSEQLGRISANGNSINWPWGALCQDGKPLPASTAARVFQFTNVPPAFRDEVKRVFPKLILPEELAKSDSTMAWESNSLKERVKRVSSLRFDEMIFESQTLPECLQQLSDRTNDIIGRGVSFSIYGPPGNDDERARRISLKFKDITFQEILKYLGDASGATIVLNEYGVRATYGKPEEKKP